MTNPSNSAPVPWHTPRDIDGHDRYSWHYHSPDTDRRIVMRLEAGTGMPASTVVGDVRVTRTSAGDLFIAYDNDGVKLGEGTSAECVAMVAQTDRAAQLGRELGHHTAGWVFEAHTDARTYAECVQLDNDGDPVWWERFGPASPPLSGEWAGALTARSLMAAVGVDLDAQSQTDPDGQWEAALCARYEHAFADAWRARVMGDARARAPH